MTINTSTNDLTKKMLCSVVFLHFDRSVNFQTFQSKDLRGAIAGLYPNEILLHQHGEDGTVKYDYPFVQYKCIQMNCLLVGIENGAELVSKLDMVGKTITLSYEKYKVLKKETVLKDAHYGILEAILSYSFLTPWLALNEKNYEEYLRLVTWAGKKELLKKILIGNIISMSKSLGYTVPEPIKVNLGNFREVKTSLKGIPMLGFLGTFSVNFEIPDYWGIGKSVSRGFGTIKRVEELRS